MIAPRLATAVVGAGPAGLLFSVAGLSLARRANVAPGAWALRVYDKRERYERTHRMRVARESWLALARALADPGFDRFIATLDACDFAPEVNVVEAELHALLEALGGRREIFALGDGPGEASLADLRRRLETESVLGSETTFTIVAADSVHSVVREWVRGDVAQERRTHEQLARLRVIGPDLPARLGAIDQVRLSKVLGSVVDYRRHKDGYAEVDLFLTGAEHALVHGLGATPRSPVELSPAVFDRLKAPLFRAIVDHLAHQGARQVFVVSTFRLEHAVMPRLTFDVPSIGATVFLLGDAGVSLPFQRGMSALGACAHSLARVHIDLLTGDQRARTIARYDEDARAVTKREIAVVRSRAQLVGTLREIVRVSALLPFPIQSWWLRAPDHDRRADHFSIWFWLNVAVAAIAVLVGLGGWSLAEIGEPAGHVLAWPSLLVQIGGGIAYHSALAFEGGPHRLVRRVWTTQIALAFVAGVAWTTAHYVTSPSLDLFAALPAWWFLLGAAFVLGLYAFERYVARWFTRAGLTFADDSS